MKYKGIQRWNTREYKEEYKGIQRWNTREYKEEIQENTNRKSPVPTTMSDL